MALAARHSLHLGDIAPQRRDRGHDDRRPRGRDELRPDQDGCARARATGSRSTTSCCASRNSSVRARPTRASQPSRRSREARHEETPQEHQRAGAHRVLDRVQRRLPVRVRVPDAFVPFAAFAGEPRAVATSRSCARRTAPSRRRPPSSTRRPRSNGSRASATTWRRRVRSCSRSCRFRPRRCR